MPDFTIRAPVSRGGDRLLLVGRKPGGADDVDEAALRELAGERDGRRRHGEVENAVGVGEQRLDLAGDQDAVDAEAGELAGVAPDRRGIARLDGADEHGAFGVGNRLDQGAAHPPPGTGHDQPHVGHRSLRFRRRYTGTRRECKANGQVGRRLKAARRHSLRRPRGRPWRSAAAAS